MDSGVKISPEGDQVRVSPPVVTGPGPGYINDDKLPVPEPNLSSLFRNETPHQRLLPLLLSVFFWGFFIYACIH